MNEPRPRILVAGVGNIFLGDDGFGGEVARRLSSASMPEGVEVVDYGIRGMHLAYDLLAGYDALIIVDVMPHGGRPGALRVIEVAADDLGSQADDLGSQAAALGSRAAALDAHGMAPVAVLAGLGSLGGTLPRTFVVGCEPASTEERMGLSPAVAASVDAAAAAVRSLVNGELGASGAGCRLPGASLPGATLSRATLSRATLSRATGREV